MFVIVLRTEPRENNGSLLWIALWILAVIAASFRFIERSSLFSDLCCVLLVKMVAETRKLTHKEALKFGALFLLWVQFPPVPHRDGSAWRLDSLASHFQSAAKNKDLLWASGTIGNVGDKTRSV